MSEQYRFRFSPKISNSQIETRLLLAGINTENVFGESAMRLDASFCFDPATRVCEIDAGTEIGRHVAKLFVAYISKEFGDAAYGLKPLSPPLPNFKNEPHGSHVGVVSVGSEVRVCPRQANDN